MLILRFRIPGCVEMPEALALGRGDLHSCVASMGGGPTLVCWGWLWPGRTSWGPSLRPVTDCMLSRGASHVLASGLSLEGPRM